MSPPSDWSEAILPWLNPTTLGAQGIRELPRTKLTRIEGGAQGLLQFLGHHRPWQSSELGYLVVGEKPSVETAYSKEQFWLAARIFSDAMITGLPWDKIPLDWNDPAKVQAHARHLLRWDPELYEAFTRAARRNSPIWAAAIVTYFGLLRRPSLALPEAGPIGDIVLKKEIPGGTNIFVPDTAHLGPIILADIFQPIDLSGISLTLNRDVGSVVAGNSLSAERGTPSGHTRGRRSKRPKKSKLVRRIPHLDLPEGKLPLKTPFPVNVHANEQSALPEETSSDLVVSFPPDQSSLDFTVWLVVTAHFRILGPDTRQITISRDQAESSIATFEVEVTDPAHATPPKILAIFQRDSRVCGAVSRFPEIPGAAPAAESGRDRPTPRLEAYLGAPAPDLTVVVANPSGDGRSFECRVSTPHLAEFKDGVAKPWVLPNSSEQFVAEKFKDFIAPNLEKNEQIFRLRGAGRELFSPSPRHFQQAFWALLDGGLPLKTISIVSDEPHIPWELMVPHRLSDQGEPRPPLGVSCAIGRWVALEGRIPPPVVALSEAWVFAPTYPGPSPRPLAKRDAEAQYMQEKFAGELVSPANLGGLDRSLGSKQKAMLHFVCHGAAGGSSQAVHGENKSILPSYALGGANEIPRACAKSRPFVFLNACDVGRTIPALTSVGGFAPAFIGLGASAVVAPLWSVKDVLAHQVATDFYDATRADSGRSFADIIRDIRSRAYDPAQGEDTYAAYCFYGDPLACQNP